MRKVPSLVMIALLLGLAPAISLSDGGDEARELQADLPLALDRLRDAWFRGDDDEALTRLAALKDDARLGGELRRWCTGMYAWQRLEYGEQDHAVSALASDFEAGDPRGHIRAIRILMAFEQFDAALWVARSGLESNRGSWALRRMEAGLLWLGGDHDAGLNAYAEIIARDTRSSYPYLHEAGSNHDWTRFDKESPDSVEAFADLFPPLHWFSTDLPGLDRCIAEMARDKEMIDRVTARVSSRFEAVSEARQALRAHRMADNRIRVRLQHEARKAEILAVLDTRVVATARLADEQPREALDAVRKALELAPTDVALGDLRARAMARTEDPVDEREETLRALAFNFRLNVQHELGNAPARRIHDRIFERALLLYRRNPEAGMARFEELLSRYEDRDVDHVIARYCLGLWLHRQGERDLAYRYLLTASAGMGHDGRRSIANHALAGELLLLDPESCKAEATGKNVGPGGQPGGPAAVPGVGMRPQQDQPAGGARLPGSAHALLHVAMRAGSVGGAMMDARAAIEALTGVEMWQSLFIGGQFWQSVHNVDGAMDNLQRYVYGLPELVAGEVPPDELAALLDPGSAYSKSVEESLFSYVESLRRLRDATSDWQLRHQVNTQMQSMLGLIEGHVLLLRAGLIANPPKDLDGLVRWLRPHTRMIDLQRRVSGTLTAEEQAMDSERERAGIPRVPNTSLLLGCALALKDAGRPADGARLIWHNRDALFGLISRQGLLTFAAALARPRDAGLSASCELLSTQSRGVIAPAAVVLEAPSMRELLKQHGEARDWRRYLTRIPIQSGGENIVWLSRVAPDEFQDVSDLVSRPFADHAEHLFTSAARGAGAHGVRLNWPLLSKGDPAAARRLAIWVFVSDLPVSQTSPNYQALAAAMDSVTALAMVMDAAERLGRDDESRRLRNLLRRCAGDAGHDLAGQFAGLGLN